MGSTICHGEPSFGYAPLSEQLVVGFVLGLLPVLAQVLGYFSSVRLHFMEWVLNAIKKWLVVRITFAALLHRISCRLSVIGVAG